MSRLELLGQIDTELPTPLHVQVRQNLKKALLNSFEKGTEFFPEQVIVTHYKLSRGTVRRALSDLTNEGLLVRKPGKGSYVTEKKGPNLKSQAFTIGVFTPRFDSLFTNEALAELSKICQDRGLNLKIYFTDGGTRVREACKQLDELPEKEALILMSEPANDIKEFSTSLLNYGYKIVHVDTTVTGLPFDYVGSDNVQGAMMAVKHLADLGHRRIGILINEPINMSSVKERIEGYLRAVRLFGLDEDKKLVCDCKTQVGQSSIESAYQNVSRLVTMPNPPTGIFVISDAGATGVYKALNEMGIKIPDDISVVGFDDEHSSRFMHPPLTTVAQSKPDIVKEAVGLLMSRVKGSGGTEPRRILVPTKLVIRDSTAPLGERKIKKVE